MKQLVILLLFIFSVTYSYSQEKEAKIRPKLMPVNMEQTPKYDKETEKEMIEAKGNFVHWFNVKDFDLFYSEDEELYKLKEVELVEVELKSLKNFSEEEKEESTERISK